MLSDKRIFIINSPDEMKLNSFMKMCSNHLKIELISTISAARKALYEMLGLKVSTWQDVILDSTAHDELSSIACTFDHIIRSYDKYRRYYMPRIADGIENFLCPSDENQILFIHVHDESDIDVIRKVAYESHYIQVKTVLITSSRKKNLKPKYNYDVTINSTDFRNFFSNVEIFCASINVT